MTKRTVCVVACIVLQVHGADTVLKREYGDLLVPADDGRDCQDHLDDHDLGLNSLPGFDVAVQLDLANLPDNWEEVVRKCGLLKRNCFAAVFEKYFEFQVASLSSLPHGYQHLYHHQHHHHPVHHEGGRGGSAGVRGS